MRSTNELAAELMQALLHCGGEPFTITKTLGNYHTREERDESGEWKNTAVSGLSAINEASANIRALGEQYPQLELHFPQIELSAKQPGDDENIRIKERQANAEIYVPKSFIEQHSGSLFRELLESEWTEQTAALTDNILRRLKKHELRNIALFGLERTKPTVIRITTDTAETAIWTILLAGHGFFPLQWDGEICGLASLLADQLRDSLKVQLDLPEAEAEALFSIDLARDEAAECCTLTLHFREEPNFS